MWGGYGQSTKLCASCVELMVQDQYLLFQECYLLLSTIASLDVSSANCQPWWYGIREVEMTCFFLTRKVRAPHLFRICFFSALLIAAYTSSATSHLHFSHPRCPTLADELSIFDTIVRFIGAIFLILPWAKTEA